MYGLEYQSPLGGMAPEKQVILKIGSCGIDEVRDIGFCSEVHRVDNLSSEEFFQDGEYPYRTDIVGIAWPTDGKRSYISG